MEILPQIMHILPRVAFLPYVLQLHLFWFIMKPKKKNYLKKTTLKMIKIMIFFYHTKNHKGLNVNPAKNESIRIIFVKRFNFSR